MANAAAVYDRLLAHLIFQAAEAEARHNDAAGLEAELVDVQSHVADHRKRIGVLKQVGIVLVVSEMLCKSFHTWRCTTLVSLLQELCP